MKVFFMKYVNDREHIYVNDKGVAIATIKKLSREQEEEFDKSYTWFMPSKGVKVDLVKTSVLNFKDYFPTKKQEEEKSDEKNIRNYIVDGVRKELNDYDSEIFTLDNFSFFEYIPERYRKLDIDIQFLITPYHFWYGEKGVWYGMDKNSLLGGKLSINGFYCNLYKKVDIRFPAFVYPKDIAKKYENNEKFKESLYMAYYNELLTLKGAFIHELKHALNAYIIAEAMETKNISVFDLFKLSKYQEFSAEVEDVFFMVNNYYSKKKIFPHRFIVEFENIVKYVKGHGNIYNRLDEFMPIVIDDVKKWYLTAEVYQEKYFELNQVKDYLVFPAHQTKTKSDDGVYEDLRRKMLSFDVYNPDTKETKTMDLSQYFENMTVTPKERYGLLKYYRRMRDFAKALQKKHLVSNRILKTVEQIRTELNQK